MRIAVLVLALLEAALEVVVLGDVHKEEVEHVVGPVLCELPDVVREAFFDKKPLPARDWVGVDQRVDGDQIRAAVLWRATFFADLEPAALGEFGEVRGVVDRREAFQSCAEGVERRSYAFISRN